jgi:hypothetical protein
MVTMLTSFRDFAMAGMAVIMLLMLSWMYVTNSRLRLLEAQHSEVVVENLFLARKLGETHAGWQAANNRRDIQLRFAVAGFRTGSWRAYQSVVMEARRTGQLPQAGAYALQ